MTKRDLDYIINGMKLSATFLEGFAKIPHSLKPELLLVSATFALRSSRREYFILHESGRTSLQSCADMMGVTKFELTRLLNNVCKKVVRIANEYAHMKNKMFEELREKTKFNPPEKIDTKCDRYPYNAYMVLFGKNFSINGKEMDYNDLDSDPDKLIEKILEHENIKFKRAFISAFKERRNLNDIMYDIDSSTFYEFINHLRNARTTLGILAGDPYFIPDMYDKYADPKNIPICNINLSGVIVDKCRLHGIHTIYDFVKHFTTGNDTSWLSEQEADIISQWFEIKEIASLSNLIQFSDLDFKIAQHDIHISLDYPRNIYCAILGCDIKPPRDWKKALSIVYDSALLPEDSVVLNAYFEKNWTSDKILKKLIQFRPSFWENKTTRDVELRRDTALNKIKRKIDNNRKLYGTLILGPKAMNGFNPVAREDIHRVDTQISDVLAEAGWI